MRKSIFADWFPETLKNDNEDGDDQENQRIFNSIRLAVGGEMNHAK